MGGKKDSWASVVVVVLVALSVRAFIVEPFRIPSGSMIPTLAIGDQIFVNKFAYNVRIPFTSKRLFKLGAPERGDVAVFIQPVEKINYIKRVIGLPGDRVEVKADGEIWVNGKAVSRHPSKAQKYRDYDSVSERWYDFLAKPYEEIYGEHSYITLRNVHDPRRSFAPIIVPEGHYFMMGDNRDNSHDSRGWGTVPEENFLGRATFIWLSFAEGWAMRWERIGQWVD